MRLVALCQLTHARQITCACADLVRSAQIVTVVPVVGGDHYRPGWKAVAGLPAQIPAHRSAGGYDAEAFLAQDCQIALQREHVSIIGVAIVADALRVVKQHRHPG